MGKVIPIVATIAAAVAAPYLAPYLGIGALNAGIGLTAGQGILFGRVAAFAVTTALSTVLSRAVAQKPRAASFAEEARGRTESFIGTLESHKIIYGRTRVGGLLYPIGTSDTGPGSDGSTRTGKNKFLHILTVLGGHEVEEIGDIYFNDLLVTLDGNGFVQTAPYLKDGISYARVIKHLGTSSQAADALLMAELPLLWTSAHQGKDIPYIYTRFEYSPDAFPLGRPTVSAVVKGKKVYDPRTTLTAWSDNPTLCIRDYLTSRDSANLPYGFGATADEVNDTYTSPAANVCEESVTKADGSTHDRYTCNGVLDTAVAPLDNLQQLVSSLAGAVTCPKGQFRIYAGAYDTPEATVIDESMLTGQIKVRVRVPRSELFNAVQGTFVDPLKNWKPTDFPAVTSAAFETQDNGERIFTDIQLPFTNDPEAAQRIAKLILRKAREQISVQMPLNYKGLQFAVWDTVKVNNTQMGWAEKVFRIESWSFDMTSGVSLQIKEENAASYDWGASDAEVIAAAPDTNLPDPFTVAPPVSLIITEELYVTRNGDGVKAKAVMSWTASPDAFVREYQAEMRLSTDTEWTLLPRTSATVIEALDIAPGTYNFRVKALNSLNVSSVYEQTTRQISGLAAPPTEPQNLYWSAIGGLAYLNWEPSPDLDVRIGGKYVFRYSPDTSDGWANSTTIGNAVSGNTSATVLPLKAGIYLVKAEDSSGIESTTAANVIVTQDTIYDLSVISTLTEDPTFSGSKTNCSVSGSVLTLTDSTLPGTYLHSSKMDLTTVKRVRLTAHLKAAVVNPSDLFDSRPGLFDDAEGTFDGTDTASADAVVFVRSTQTDPNGSPTWTAWNRLDSGEFVARGFDFKTELVSYDSAFNIEISELNVKAAEL